MAENSKIEWTDHTHNPWMGCTHVSEGCVNCYAERDLLRWKRVEWGPKARRVRTSLSNRQKPLTWNRQAEKSGVRKRVFCASLADWLDDHPSIEISWRVDLLHTIFLTLYLDWMLLTKRPENWRPILEAVYKYESGHGDFGAWIKRWLDGKPPANVWVGTSVESAKWRSRIEDLRKIPAVVRFLSMEPLVAAPGRVGLRGIHLVIAGGESGPNARPMHPSWPRSIRDQCVKAGVAFFFKQWGEWIPSADLDIHDPRLAIVDGPRYYKLPANEIGAGMTRIGTKNSGRALDGEHWDQMPTPAH